MTERDRCWQEYQRSHASARRALLLGAIVLAGVLLGYRSTGNDNISTMYSISSTP